MEHEVSVKLIVMVRVDNVRVTYVAGDVTASSHVKHVDIRHKYMNEYVKEDIVKIIVVKSVDKVSDILTKNLSNELHGKHSNKMICE